MSAVINISFRRPTCLATLGLPSRADSEIKFLDQDFQRHVLLPQDAAGRSLGTSPLQ